MLWYYLFNEKSKYISEFETMIRYKGTPEKKIQNWGKQNSSTAEKKKSSMHLSNLLWSNTLEIKSKTVISSIAMLARLIAEIFICRLRL